MPTETLTVEDMDNLRHMLGVTPTHPEGYRNYFVAGGAAIERMERLRAHGLVEKDERWVGVQNVCYRATPKGARFLGLKQLP